MAAAAPRADGIINWKVRASQLARVKRTNLWRPSLSSSVQTIIECVFMALMYIRARKNAVIQCPGDDSPAEQVHLPYRYANLARGPAGTRPLLVYVARLIACINFCYKTRGTDGAAAAGRPRSLAIKRDAYIFDSPNSIRGG